MNVLSLFDGMSCGQIALNRAGISYDNYFASEIDKHAINETMTNFPNTIQLGDVTKITADNLPKIDLVIGGSPCQGFSSSGKGLNFEDPRSKLFFEFVRILKETKPTYFLLENVKMKKEYEDIITKELGVEPITINSSLVSSQNRVRLYWTNIPNVSQPEDKNIKLSDILDDIQMKNPAAIRGRRLNKATIIGRRVDERGKRQDYNKDVPITQCLEVRDCNVDKSNCLTTVQKDNVLTPLPYGRHLDAFKKKLPFRYYTTKECCRLQTVPDDYFKVSSDTQIRKMLGNGWTVDVIAHIFKNLQH
jgi:DNA (cytosine-5)-methyltransferase 3A